VVDVGDDGDVTKIHGSAFRSCTGLERSRRKAGIDLWQLRPLRVRITLKPLKSRGARFASKSKPGQKGPGKACAFAAQYSQKWPKNNALFARCRPFFELLKLLKEPPYPGSFSSLG
jgi:hypothetical protein